MTNCPHCLREIPGDRSSCPFCGTAFNEADAPTELFPEEKSSAPTRPARTRLKARAGVSQASVSFDSIDDARFTPGTTLAGRYRIVSLLGRGGMGEVYRADDLKLGQPVALKFLPEILSADGVALARFHREVRIARQVSHRNVCRVYDIGEVDGQHFLSMEFIKGEELASLIRRIGRLPADKAVEIARQLCAGLSAAHDNRVLHRDLKPANVMIDADGNVRITDFGLAGLAEEIHRDEVRAGTPAYMAPEQLEGSEVTVKSDIYSLGLVLYEVFTGKRAFAAGTLDEFLRLRRSDATPASPSSIVKEIDPLVERVILRCLEKDPRNRPSSALQVAAALPGGDPLQAALAAGETPSPEMVAAAPKEGVLRPAVAFALLASVLVALAAFALLSKRVFLHGYVPLEKTPEVLRERASEVAARLGYAAPADTEDSFFYDADYLIYVRDQDRSLNRWDKLATARPTAIRFWHRQSPSLLEPLSGSNVWANDPPNNRPGMVFLTLDTKGNLTSFEGVPPQSDDRLRADEQPDWAALFREAGLDQAAFKQADSKWTPPHAYDVRAAWEGTYPGAPELPLRVEAAGYRGRPVYFELVNPWKQSAEQVMTVTESGEQAGFALVAVLFFVAFFVGAYLAWRNLRLGRGDRRGAFRLALFFFFTRMSAWVVTTHHVTAISEATNLLTSGLQSALFWSIFIALMYLALEPFLRRRWPERAISWSRLLAGDWRDALVGRDILIGAVFGVAVIAAWYLGELVPRWVGLLPNIPDPIEEVGYGARFFLTLLMSQVGASLAFTFVIAFILLFLSMLLRKEWLGIGVGWALICGAAVLVASWKSPVTWAFHAVMFTLLVVAVKRFSLVVALVALIFQHMIIFFPITTDLSAWYATSYVLDLAFLVALTVFGFYTSLGGQPLVRGKLLGD
ncbi:MAG TPA: protein kinase [Pyrinomonadaceae bacterium]|nr:protein kinase [Pyrinomonadaceae bacterium]